MNFIWIVIPGSEFYLSYLGLLKFSNSNYSVDLSERGSFSISHSDGSEDAVFNHQERPIDRRNGVVRSGRAREFPVHQATALEIYRGHQWHQQQHTWSSEHHAYN